MSNYNIIPLGDHCSIAMVLRELNLRKQSYPFDWIMCTEQLHDTNIINNAKIIDKLTNTNFKEITIDFLGDGPINKSKTHNKIMFPHEKGSLNEIYDKYLEIMSLIYL